jgi:hypothetical protein
VDGIRRGAGIVQNKQRTYITRSKTRRTSAVAGHEPAPRDGAARHAAPDRQGKPGNEAKAPGENSLFSGSYVMLSCSNIPLKLLKINNLFLCMGSFPRIPSDRLRDARSIGSFRRFPPLVVPGGARSADPGLTVPCARGDGCRIAAAGGVRHDGKNGAARPLSMGSFRRMKRNPRPHPSPQTPPKAAIRAPYLRAHGRMGPGSALPALSGTTNRECSAGPLPWARSADSSKPSAVPLCMGSNARKMKAPAMPTTNLIPDLILTPSSRACRGTKDRPLTCLRRSEAPASRRQVPDSAPGSLDRSRLICHGLPVGGGTRCHGGEGG